LTPRDVRFDHVSTPVSAAEEWDFLRHRVLVVSTYRPNEDGIARYTEQLLDALGPSGRRFVRLGIAPGGGDRVRFMAGWLRPLKLLADIRDVDDVVVMYIPTYFQAGHPASRIASLLSLWLVSRLRPTTFVIHETDLQGDPPVGRRHSIESRILERARRLLWARPALVFHTEYERRRFAERYPGRAGRVERLVDHGAAFTTTVEISKQRARAKLGLSGDRAIVLMIGFFSPHKRFELGIKAVAQAGRDDLELHIVGSPISDWPEVQRCVEELRDGARRTPHVHLHERFVSDDEFDLWIRAADTVLVPYENASSSGVVARAQLLGTALITSGAGGIAEQLTDSDTRFSSDAELLAAIRAIPAPAAAGDRTARA
jgi:glycosyltransferase involved in cell wall biosynthesis